MRIWIVLLLIGIVVATQPASGEEWILVLDTPDEVFLGTPARWYAYSYEYVAQQYGFIEMRLTVFFGLDIVYTARVSNQSAPAEITYTPREAGQYSYILWLNSSAGVETMQGGFIVREPPIEARVEAYYLLPIRLHLSLPPDYVGLEMTVWIGGDRRVFTYLGAGEYVVPIPATKPSGVLRLVVAGIYEATYPFQTRPATLRVEYGGGVELGGGYVNASAGHYIDGVFTPIDTFIDMRIGDRNMWGVNGTLNMYIQPTSLRPLEARIAYEALEDDVRRTYVEIPVVISYDLTAYRIEPSPESTYVDISLWRPAYPQSPSLILRLDSYEVEIPAQHVLGKAVHRLRGGLPVPNPVNATLLWRLGGDEVVIRSDVLLPQPPDKVYADFWTPPEPYIWWVEEMGKDYYTIAYYHPDGLAPITYATIQVLYPEITLREGVLRWSGTNPDASIVIYCPAPQNIPVLSIDGVGGSGEAVIPRIANAEYVGGCIARYIDEEYVQTVSETLVVAVKTVWREAVPTDPIPDDAKAMVEWWMIDGVKHSVGDRVALEEGIYTLTIAYTNGYIANYTVTVLPLRITVIQTQESGGWRVSIYAPDGVEISVRLENGVALTLGPGTYEFRYRIVHATHPYAEVEIHG